MSSRKTWRLKYANDLEGNTIYVVEHVVHRGINRANILFRKTGAFRTLTLVIFCRARVLEEDEELNDICGSLGYIAPEMYMGEYYRFEVDMFAFGVLLFHARAAAHRVTEYTHRGRILMLYKSCHTARVPAHSGGCDTFSHMNHLHHSKHIPYRYSI